MRHSGWRLHSDLDRALQVKRRAARARHRRSCCCSRRWRSWGAKHRASGTRCIARSGQRRGKKGADLRLPVRRQAPAIFLVVKQPALSPFLASESCPDEWKRLKEGTQQPPQMRRIATNAASSRTDTRARDGLQISLHTRVRDEPYIPGMGLIIDVLAIGAAARLSASHCQAWPNPGWVPSTMV